MGGILSADILFKNEIALFAVHQNTACIKITEGHTWHPLHTLGAVSYTHLDVYKRQAQRLLEIIQQADTQLLSRPIETLKKQLHLHLKEYVFHVPNKKP